MAKFTIIIDSTIDSDISIDEMEKIISDKTLELSNELSNFTIRITRDCESEYDDIYKSSTESIIKKINTVDDYEF